MIQGGAGHAPVREGDPRFADFALTRVPRLSVMPVTDAQWAMLTAMGQG